MEKLQKLLAGEIESHVMPFLWVRGDAHERYAGQLDAMQEAGIREFCIEPRFYENYGSEQWWGDVEFLLEEGKRRGMGVWSLDDSHFPTGTANGEVQKHHPELRKRYLRLATFDVLGPLEGADLNLRYTAAAPGDRIIGIFCQRRTSEDEPDVRETIDLTCGITSRADYLTGRPEFDWTNHPTGHDYGPCPVVSLDGIGEGQWYVNVLFTSYEGGEKMTEGYLNPLDPAATQVLIDTVYQQFYDRFSEYFGTTFKGFFSDEARFGNIHGSEDASIGRNPQMVLPWREDLAELLAARLDGTSLAGLDAETLLPYLPLLFVGECEAAHVLRYAYMDLVSELYGKNFEGMMAAWCREHGVEKIGHIIEDNKCETWSEPRTLEGRPQWVSRLPGLASFSGKARYAFTVELSEADAAKPAKVELEGVSEGATVTVGGVDCGTAIVAPYSFRADGALKAGKNEIVVETDNSLGRAIDDFMGVYLPNDPTGLSGATLWLEE